MSTKSNLEVPLCVDLDGTLLRTDLLLESVLCLIKQRPLTVFFLPFWLFKGKAFLKHAIAQRVDLSGSVFPYSEDVIEYVKEQRLKRKTVLVTGSHQKYAEMVAEQVDLFDEVKGSSETVNLTNIDKRDWLIEQFGEQGFDYIGNDKDDLEVWPAAREALVVSPEGGIADSSGRSFSKIFRSSKPSTRDYLKMMRVHQWAKNVLVLVPFVLDQRFGDWSALFEIVLAFIAFCLLASMTYIFNDMLDLQADRRNKTKSKRALANGRVSLMTGIKTMLLLGVGLLLTMVFLPGHFILVLIVYLFVTLLYSFVLKQLSILDVSTIAILHTLRVIGGTVAIAAEWSFWLLAFSMFVFFSLALAKRVSELKNLVLEDRTETLGRDYKVTDLPVLMAIGVSAGYLSILVVALYINSEKVLRMYSSPEMLWLLCPILMYWLGRLWLITWRGELHEDPVIFAIRDRISQVTAGLMGWVVAMAVVV